MTTPAMPVEAFALLWSGSQRCFHVEPLRKMMETNRRLFSEGRITDYVVMFTGSDDDCRLAARLMRQRASDIATA